MNKQSIITSFCGLILVMIITGASFASSTCPGFYDTTPLEYFGPRQLAMGGAGIAVYNGLETVYTNPAGIVNEQDSFNLSLPLILPFLQYDSLTIGDDTLRSVDELFGNIGDDDASAIKDMVPKKFSFGNQLLVGYSGYGFIPALGSHMFIGGYNKLRGGVSLLNPVVPYLKYNIKADTVFGIGFANRYADEAGAFTNIRGGFQLKHIDRIAAYDPDQGKEAPYITIADVIGNKAAFSFYDVIGYGLDLGVLADVETALGPGSIGLSIYNIFGWLEGARIKMSMDEDDENAGYQGNVRIKVPTTARAGIALQPFNTTANAESYFRHFLVAADYDIVYPTDSYLKRFHCGIEQPLLGDWLKLQMGLNQGYGTMGLLIDSGYRLGLAYYTEEWGDEVGKDPHSFYVLTSGLYF